MGLNADLYYWIQCDGIGLEGKPCTNRSPASDYESSAWGDASEAKSFAQDDEFALINGQWLCYYCQPPVEDDE